jgi:hypothetical protein
VSCCGPDPTRVGALDLNSLAPPRALLDGVLSPDFFAGVVVTIDYSAREVRVEDRASLPGRRGEGESTRGGVVRSGPWVGMFLELLPLDGHRINGEVDTGLDQLILPSRGVGGARYRSQL